MTLVKSHTEMECLVRVTWDWLYSPDPFYLKWRLQHFKSLMPMLKTSPFDWHEGLEVLQSPLEADGVRAVQPVPEIGRASCRERV